MNKVCQVCMHHCSLRPGQTGICGARRNENGTVICGNYGLVTSMALDPIEKKPLKMFRPGSRILSVGSYGCNLRCPFCQNYEISMADEAAGGTLYISPKDLAYKALEYKDAGNIGVAFTYNEPLVGWEYVRDTARLVREAGMVNVLVTNGSVTQEVLEELLPFTDAMNIDLKGFRADSYRKLGGDLETVKAFIRRAAESCHVEITTLIVPEENDSLEEMEEEAQWIASLGGEIPLHVTRFFPRYHMEDRGPTDIGRVYLLAETARKYLKNVFVGNC
ncbi:AmmeMemoRadiSam system radical SAM enzyme [Muricomes sp. OA1]|uniref:AmmeMemoRadiSam system radical SAM enzyme n=1 Tax=Hungatella hathewayi TaxID=154046 RepID=A0A3E2WKN1_9FIRM|nr:MULTISPECIES: AmmeMemoRadiSam system radical SAM enzyme [Clostridia]MCH1972046.1 AmmeMemoRadiSam system radical SAM enzyme [Muricomes sp. OA1]MRM88118.1 AmmeMemoRadiSam system radical SAM enzyme [Faecalicatena contorta]RGC27246.1 AmmeMemoRadiSam system radical SAM enzyme [Hungatella hathewayi]GKH30848.1 AmmeMemoRadiSam system radical SAM enzyme [Faecalicatena contorta]